MGLKLKRSNIPFLCHLEPSNLHIQWHKNCLIWLRNEKNIAKHSIIGTCDEQFYASSFVFLHWFNFNENGTLDLDCFLFQVHLDNSKFKLFHIFLFKWISFQWPVWVTLAIVVASMKEPEPTSAQWRMNGFLFLLGFSSLANYGDYLSYSLFSPPLTTHKQAVSR
jgi:hypothetical protein